VLTLLQFLIIFIVISIVFGLLRLIFAIIKGMIIIRRSIRNSKDHTYKDAPKNYSNYEDGKTIELTKDQYKVE
jgi:hypothetical protein